MKQWGAAADQRVTAEALYEDLTTDFRPELAGVTTPITVIVPWSDMGFGEERTLGFCSGFDSLREVQLPREEVTPFRRDLTTRR